MRFTRDDLIDGDMFENIANELGVVYCDTHDLYKHINNKFVISHNSDGCVLPVDGERRPLGVDRDYDFFWKDIPDTLTKLFAQNVDVDDERIVCIPIGLERARWFPHVEKHKQILDLANVQSSPKKLAYLNVNPSTNLERSVLIDMMKDKSWCTHVDGKNGMGFSEYVQHIRNHKFTFSPDGNGLDGHRTWEALYLGSIPIVNRHVYTESFAEHLPILIVDKWEDVTEEYLNSQYEILMNKEWNWDMLKMSYWRDLIKKEIER